MKRYAPHRLMTAPAQRTAELWRTGLGAVLVLVIMFGLTQGILGLIRAVVAADTYLGVLSDLNRGDTPAGLLMLLFMMGLMGVATFVVTETLHRRAPATLLGPGWLCAQQFARVLGYLLVLNLGLTLCMPIVFETSVGLDPIVWLRWLPLTLVALVIQTGSEELLFRGYLQSQLAARFRHPLIWMGVPSALFALGHHAPETFGDNAIFITIWAGLFGLIAADLTARSGTLGPAIALHLVNNFWAMAVSALPGEMSGLALRQLPFGTDDLHAMRAYLPVDLGILLVSWLTARLSLRV